MQRRFRSTSSLKNLRNLLFALLFCESMIILYIFLYVTFENHLWENERDKFFTFRKVTTVVMDIPNRENFKASYEEDDYVSVNADADSGLRT